jgi:hypothetical protein
VDVLVEPVELVEGPVLGLGELDGRVYIYIIIAVTNITIQQKTPIPILIIVDFWELI